MYDTLYMLRLMQVCSDSVLILLYVILSTRTILLVCELILTFVWIGAEYVADCSRLALKVYVEAWYGNANMKYPNVLYCVLYLVNV